MERIARPRGDFSEPVRVTPVSQWSIDTLREDLIQRDTALKEYLEALVKANDRLTIVEFENDHQALKVALDSVNARLELLNEFRKQSADRDQGFMARSEAVAKFEMMSALLSACLPRAEAFAKFDALSAGQDSLRDRVTKIESMSGGARQNWAGILAAVGGLGVIVALIVGVMAMFTFMGSARTPQPAIGVEPPPVRTAPAQ